MSLIAPGKYLTRDGRTAVVEKTGSGLFPLKGRIGLRPESWTVSGLTFRTGNTSPSDLVSRLDDAPNPLIAPLEWALSQLEPSLDPDWQAAHAAALEALAKAKGGAK